MKKPYYNNRPTVDLLANMFSLACLALLCAGAPCARAATITVTNTADSGAGTLRAALAGAANGDTINFSVTGTIRLTSGELVVNKSLNIVGPGPATLAVNGNAASRVFHFTPSVTVNIAGLAITNGRTAAVNSGAGIYNDHATLTLSNCTVNGNSSAGNAGGIYSYGSSGRATLTIVNCTLSGNSCSNFAGCIYNDGNSGIATLTITNSTLIGNSAGSAAGAIASNGDNGGNASVQLINSIVSSNAAIRSSPGGIDNDGRAGRASVEIIGSTLTANSATNGSGGAIGNLGSATGTATITVTNSILSRNVAGQGGAIFNEDGIVTIASSSLSNNLAGLGGAIVNEAQERTTTLQVSNSTLSGNAGIGDYSEGGAIYNFGYTNAVVAIAASTLSGNSADQGGGIYNYAISSTNVTVLIINSTLSGNVATTSGGGIYNYGDSSGSATLTLVNSIVNSNSALAGGGGGIRNNGQAVFLPAGKATAIISNSVVSGNVGSGIVNFDGTLAVANSTVNGNSGGFAAGGVDSDTRNATNASVRIVNSTFSGNSSDNSASAIYNSGNTSAPPFEILNCTVDAPTNTLAGVYNASGNMKIGSTLLNGGGPPQGTIGASFSSGATIISLGYNLSSDSGGRDPLGHRILTNATDRINTDPLLGPLQNNGGPTLTHALQCGSPAIDQGKNFGALPTDQRGGAFARTFDDPAIPNPPGGDGTDIGAIELQQCACRSILVTTTADSGPGSLRAAILEANTCPGTNIIEFAPSAFGTIRLTSGELAISDHLIISGPGPGNVAVDGNAASRIFRIAPSNTVAIAGLTLTNGRAVGVSPTILFGGGIWNNHATLSLSNCTVTGNSADIGGGICNDAETGSANLQILNCTISSNSVPAGMGGGIWNRAFLGGSASLVILNSSINGNIAASGGGIVNQASQGGATANLQITNCTLSGNLANRGGGVWNLSFGANGGASASLRVFNCALNGNSAIDSGGGILDEAQSGGSATLTIIGSSVHGNSAGSGGGIYDDGLTGTTRLQISSSTLSGNSASFSGGGIYDDGRAGSASLQIASSTLSGNTALAISGGGIFNYGAKLAIANSTLSGNSAAQYGGGIFNNANGGFSSVLSITNSTLSDNSSIAGGAIFNDGRENGHASLQMVNSTLSGNSASFSGGGIYNDGRSGSASVQVGATILKAGALGANVVSDSGPVTSLGYNLSSDNGGGVLTNATDQINTDPKLGPLQDNGGLTFTHAFTCRSPAIDRGKNFTGSATDQRGLSRIFDDPAAQNAPGGDGTDIGAFEAQVSLPICDRPPVADASATVPLVISANSINATVILNGSRSSDPDGDVLHYTWYEAGRPAPLASGVVAVTTLPVGIHTIRLVVSDGTLSDTNSVTVEVITAAQAVERLVTAANEGVSRSAPLRATLSAALASIDRSNPVSAISQLIAFQNQVRAQVTPIDPELAATFIQAAQEIIDALSGGSTNPGGRPHGHFTSVNRQSNGHVRMQFSAEPAGTYIIEASTNLRDWEMIGVATPLPDGSFQFEDGQTARYPTRFYRVRAL